MWRATGGPRNIQARMPGTAGAHTGLSNLYIWGTGRLECPVDSLTIPSPSQVESKKKTRRQMSRLQASNVLKRRKEFESPSISSVI